MIGFNRRADGFPNDIALDVASGFMYWTDRSDGNGNGRIQRSDLDGNNTQTLISDIGLINPGSIALDTAGGKMYWANNNLGTIMRANLDGSDVEDLIVGLTNPLGLTLDLDEGRFYWSDNLEGTIERANLDGSDRRRLQIGSQRTIQDIVILGSVPEPASMILMLSGFLMLARRR